LYRTMVF